MLIGRKSPLTGQLNHMDLDITEGEAVAYHNGEKFIQDAFPRLNANEREFYKTGYTAEDWVKIFGEDE